jgi:hypothetical protein
MGSSQRRQTDMRPLQRDRTERGGGAQKGCAVIRKMTTRSSTQLVT